MGVLAYELLVGYAPFERETRLATYEHILYNEPEFPPFLSDEAVSFIKAALCKVWGVDMPDVPLYRSALICVEPSIPVPYCACRTPASACPSRTSTYTRG